MHPQQFEGLHAGDGATQDAEIFQFPVTEWDRLELWRRREEQKAKRAIELRNAALRQI